MNEVLSLEWHILLDEAKPNGEDHKLLISSLYKA